MYLSYYVTRDMICTLLFAACVSVGFHKATFSPSFHASSRIETGTIVENDSTLIIVIPDKR